MIKCYAKIFFITGSLFFLGMLFSNLSIMEFRPALANAVSLGILLGAAMALIMGTMHVVKAREAAAGEGGFDIYSVVQVRRLESTLPYDRLFDAVVHYLKGEGGCAVTGSDHDGGAVYARTPFNFTTFGSSVTVRLEKRQEGPTLVTITARPASFSILADYGENLKLARGVAAYLKGLQQG